MTYTFFDHIFCSAVKLIPISIEGKETGWYKGKAQHMQLQPFSVHFKIICRMLQLHLNNGAKCSMMCSFPCFIDCPSHFIVEPSITWQKTIYSVHSKCFWQMPCHSKVSQRVAVLCWLQLYSVLWNWDIQISESICTIRFGWSEDVQYRLFVPILRQQIIITNAHGKDGFMPILYHKSRQSTDDFNGARNFRNYNKWLIEKVILNPFPHSAAGTRPPLTMSKHIQLSFQECNDMVDKKVIKKLINIYFDRKHSQHFAATAVSNRTQPQWRWSWAIMKNWTPNKMSPSSW